MSVRTAMLSCRRARIACAVASAFLLIVSCGAPYPAPNTVDRARFLTVLADRVVLSPGEIVTLRALVAGRGAPSTFEWRLCVVPYLVPAGTQAQACFDTPEFNVFPALEGERGTFRMPDDMDTIIRWVFMSYGRNTSPAAILSSLERNGLDLLVVVRGESPSGTLRASKRLLLTISGMRAPRVAVPPFRFGEARLQPSASDPERCVRADGAPTIVAPGQRLMIEAEGMDLPRLSHFADGGVFEPGDNRPDLVPWTAPATPGHVSHWLVAQRNVSRENGPGVSVVAFCAFDVEVR